MGQPLVITGRVNNVREEERATRSTDLRFAVSFRIDNRPVWMLGRPEMAPGDQATVAGWDKGTAIKCFAIRNDTTGVVYKAPGLKKVRSWQYAWLIAPFLLAKCTSDFGAGGFFAATVLALPFVALSIFARGQTRAISSAIERLEKMPAAPVPQQA